MTTNTTIRTDERRGVVPYGAQTSKRCTVLALLMATMVSTVGTAEATVYWWSGATGTYGASPLGVCRYYDQWGKLVVSNNTHPIVYARNYTAGLGNDWQWVRYRPYVVDMNGAILMAGQWTGFRPAWDHSPAVFTAAELQKLAQFRQHFRLVLYIEWWNQTQTQVLGAAADRIETYYLYYGDNTSPPYGPADRCSYFKPVGF